MTLVVEVASADLERWRQVDETLATILKLGFATPRILAIAQARYDVTEGLRLRLQAQRS